MVWRDVNERSINKKAKQLTVSPFFIDSLIASKVKLNS
jgi:hypothetical protein